jgi:hypothetical protein
MTDTATRTTTISRVSRTLCAPPLALCALIILAIATKSSAMGLPKNPQITVFNDNVRKTMQASCCIHGIVTYYEIYEDRNPEVGTYRLESERKAPNPDGRVVMLLQNALLAYAKKAGLDIEGAPQEMPVHQKAQEVPVTPLNQHLAPNTPLIPPAPSSVCCKKCVIL